MSGYVIYLVINLIMASGEKHAMKAEMPSLEEGYMHAQARLEIIEEEFEHREESRIGVGCFLVKRTKDS